MQSRPPQPYLRTVLVLLFLLGGLVPPVNSLYAGEELQQAAAAGDMVQLEALLKAHPGQAESRNFAGRTALGLAAEKGHLEAVQLLLQMGAEIDGKDSSGRTALVWAEQAHQDAVAKELRARGAGAIDFSRINDQAIAGSTWCIFIAIAVFGLGLIIILLTRKKRTPEQLLSDEMND